MTDFSDVWRKVRENDRREFDESGKARVTDVEPPWLRVWLQGGEADGHEYMTLIEPERVLYFAPDPRPDVDNWVRVDSDWEGAFAYERVPSVEQFDRERIYYPMEWLNELRKQETA